MAKADRVHSTPRRTASKSKPLKQRVKSNEAENSARYLAIEPLLCDVYRAAEIAHDAVADDKEYASFAVFQLFNMVGDLREMFYGRPVAQKAVA
jgi:hypothetical protein